MSNRYDMLDKYFEFMGLQVSDQRLVRNSLKRLEPDIDWKAIGKSDMGEFYARDEGISENSFRALVEEFGFKKTYSKRS